MNPYRKPTVACLVLLLLPVLPMAAAEGEEQALHENRIVLEHQFWLAVREGVLEEERAEALRERLVTLLAEQGVGGEDEPHAERTRNRPPDREWIRQVLSPLLEDTERIALDRLAESRRDRQASAAAALALAWLDRLLFFPEEDREAWKAHLLRCADDPEFVTALVRDRKWFLHRLPALFLPPVEDPVLLRSETLDILWKSILSGNPPRKESGKPLGFAGMDLGALRALAVELQRGVEIEEFLEEFADLMRAILDKEMEEWHARQLRVGGDWLVDKEVLERYARAVLARYNENLGSLEERDALRLSLALKGAVPQWMEEENERWKRLVEERRFVPGPPLQRLRETTWIGDVDPDTLIGHPLYQRALREVFTLHDYAVLQQARADRISRQTLALQSFAVARMDSRLLLDRGQRMRAWTVSRAFDPGRGDSFGSLCMEIARELENGELSFWQQRELARLGISP